MKAKPGSCIQYGIKPGIAVPVLVLLNLLLAWRSFVASRSGRSRNHRKGPLEASHVRPRNVSFVVLLWGLFAPRVVKAVG